MSGPKTVDEKKAFMDGIWATKDSLNAEGWSRHIHPKVELHSYDGTVIVFKYVVDPKDCNLMGTLHGGAIATLADNLTTYPIILEDRNLRAGVSTSLVVDYASAPKPGEAVYIECKADKIGKHLGFSTAIFRNEKGELIAKASHTKFMGVGPQTAKL